MTDLEVLQKIKDQNYDCNGIMCHECVFDKDCSCRQKDFIELVDKKFDEVQNAQL